ncbi:MAG TPA: ABC-F family ATP-binding cassette domain-containing protein [Gemmatimonadaceae bacterium]|nr:ABC-F family ATP-binding cassette domain-containing protein [Gemmatimonadaceae bacterium]
MTILSVSDVAVTFGADRIFARITFTVGRGEHWGIIGRNGTGKTTLFRLLTGAMQPSSGQVTRQPGLRVSLMEQQRDYGGAETVWDAAAGPFAELRALETSLGEQAARIGELGERASEQLLDRYARDLERFEREGGYTFAPRVDAVLHGLGFDPERARTQPLTQLSGGERGRVGLARQLAAPADVLLLDEPTNHLDLETTRWLEQYLHELDATVLVVSHDRAFLEAVADHVLHFENGTATPYVGGYAAFVAQRTERRLTQLREYDKQAKKVAAEEDYIRRNIAGQNTRQAKGRRKRLERMPRLSPPRGEAGAMAVRFAADERGGDQALVAERVRIAIEGRVLIEEFTATANRGDVIGLVGPNGAGKSTFLRALLGERGADGGVLRVGGSVRPAYYRQDMTQVPTDKTIYDIVGDLRPTWTRGQVQGHLGRFDFSGDEVQRRAGTLSGGERARVALAMMMLSGANLLIFDEPTNHLDVESIEALEDAIEDYEGTVLLVSHDRALLRALATRVWVLHERRITDFDGSFAEWEAVSAERAHAARVAAQEEEALRRVKERKRTGRGGDGARGGGSAGKKGQEAAARRAQRAAQDAEARVAKLEAEVAELTRLLDDPALYNTPNGPRRASALGSQLDQLKRQLDDALDEWTKATEVAESLT